MVSRLFGDVATEAEHHADLRAREEDLTPRGVVRAVLAAAVPRLRNGYSRVLDVCAGYGVWSSELRALHARCGWIQPHITAVEIDERKEPHMRKWADEALAGVDWARALDPQAGEGGHYGLAMGNPHFSALVATEPGRSMPGLLLEKCGAVLLFHQEQSLQKSASGARVWHTYPPAAVFSVPGSVRFRVGRNPETGKRYGADSRCYQATLWLRGHRGPAELVMLPWLDSLERRWTVQPGTEEPEDARRPAAPGWGRR